MMTKWGSGLLLGGLLFLTGCSVTGKWSLVEVEPTAARRDFDLQSMTLHKDGTFYAEAREAGDIETVSGTYTYQNKTLTLREHDGENMVYDAKFLSGNRLELARTTPSGKINATFERREQFKEEK